MKKFLLAMLTTGLISLLSLGSLAQDDEMTTFEFDNSDATLMFPADWEQETDDDGVVTLTTDGISMMIYDATTLADVFEIDDAESAEDILEAVADSLPVPEDVELDAGDAKAVELDDREVLRLVFEADETTGTVIVVPLTDDTFGLVMAMVDSDDADDLSPLTDDVVTSFAIGEAATSGEACVLSTDTDATVQIRVGPGTNRTVIAFLPANVDFTAQGQSIDDDGTVWFRIPQEEAAPNKAVNETWVAGDAVEQSGDCDNVEGAVAPPIIPIREAQPTAVPQSTTTETTTDTTTDTSADTTTTETTTIDTTTDTSAASAVDASGAIIPTVGTWFLSFDVGSANCNGVSSTYDSGFGSYFGSMSGGGSRGLIFDGGLIPFVGNNTYEDAANIAVSGGTVPARFTVTLTSPTTAYGSFGFVVQSCTAFVPFTIGYTG